MKRKELLAEISSLDKQGLDKKAKELANEIVKLEIRHKSGQLDTPHRLSLTRRNLARVLEAKSKIKSV